MVGLLPFRIPKRIFASFGAVGFSQAVTLGTQILSIPILLSVWRPEVLGIWMGLTAFTSMLSLTDGGFGVVASNRMSILFASSQSGLAQTVMTTAMISILVAAGLVMMILGGCLALLNFQELLIIDEKALPNLEIIVLALGAGTMLGQVQNLLFGFLRSIGLFSFATHLTTVTRLSSWSLQMATAGLTGCPLWVGVATFGGALASVCCFALIAWMRFSRFGTPPSLWNREEFHGLLRPALSQMSVPICWAISNQVLTQVVLAVLGPLITLTYTTHRTIGNLVLQAVNPINQVVIPEYSHEYGRGNLVAINRLYRYSCIGSTIIALVGLVLAMGVGPSVLPIWTRQTVSFDPLLFSLIGISALLRALWLTSSMFGYAINMFGTYAIAWLVSSALTLLSVGAFIVSYGIHGVAIGSVLGECMMVLFVLPHSRRLIRRMKT